MRQQKKGPNTVEELNKTYCNFYNIPIEEDNWNWPIKKDLTEIQSTNSGWAGTSTSSFRATNDYSYTNSDNIQVFTNTDNIQVVQVNSNETFSETEENYYYYNTTEQAYSGPWDTSGQPITTSQGPGQMSTQSDEPDTPRNQGCWT